MSELKRKCIINNHDELEFIIFCIENISVRLKVPGEQVYDLLASKSDILETYLVPNYDILHTQDKNYIVDDVLEVMEERGVSV